MICRGSRNISAARSASEVEQTREHPSDIWTISDKTSHRDRHMALLERNYLDKHDAVNHTARALTEHGCVYCGRHLHHVGVKEGRRGWGLRAVITRGQW